VKFWCLPFCFWTPANFEAQQSVFNTTPKCPAFKRTSVRAGQGRRAAVLLERSREQALHADAPLLEHQAAVELAKECLARGRARRAASLLEEAITAVERARSNIGVDAYKRSFIGDKNEAYGLLFEYHWQRRDLAEALTISERARSRALLDMMSSGPSRWTLRRPITSREHERALRERIDYLHTQVHHDGAHGLGEVLADAERGYERLVNETQASDPAYAATVSAGAAPAHEVLDYWDASGFWQDDLVAVSYYFARDRLRALVVRADGVSDARVDANRTDIARLLRAFRAEVELVARLGPTRGREITQSADSCLALLEQAYDLVWAPIEEAAKAAAHVLVVPDGPLHGLPFAALWDGCAYLAERHTVSYLPSLSTTPFCYGPDDKQFDTCALIVGETLQDDNEVAETELMHHLFGADAAVVRLGGENALDRLRTEAAGKGVVHLAGHGFFNAQRPMLSGIELSRAHRLFAWDLMMSGDIFQGSSLVSIASCKSGMAQAESGDELTGLVRALMCAGAKSTVLALWDVEEAATKLFFESLYASLRDTKCSRAQAVAAACAAVRQEADMQHPFFWAPFVLIGDHR